MVSTQIPGVCGRGVVETKINDGTNARQPSPRAGPLGSGSALAVKSAASADAAAAAAPAAPVTDAEIEALDLADAAKQAAYALKKKHPTVTFTSGRRTKQDQARAMAGNVVKNRKWIEETYSKSGVRDACQKWIDDHPDSKTRDEIEKGLVEILNKYSNAQLGVFSKHISGMAFDVQPVAQNADAIKKTLRELTDKKGKFLDKEGGLVRWHAQFN